LIGSQKVASTGPLGGAAFLVSNLPDAQAPHYIKLESRTMTTHMPPVPPANRSNKGPKNNLDSLQDNSLKHPPPQNTSEQGDTANIKQNTTNKGYFKGRRVK
jgi:hypothetical protein